MKYLSQIASIALLILGSVQYSNAQELTDYPLAVEHKGLLNYLAELAWANNPSNDNYFQEEVIAKEEIKMAKRGWWSNASADFNFNEANLKAGNGAGDNIFFPRYNFGVSLNLASFFDTPNETKIAQRRLLMAESDSEQAKKDVKTKVFKLYQKYLASIEILKIRSKSEQDAKTTSELVEQLFNTGKKVGLQDLNDSYRVYYDAQEARVKANTELTLAKMELESFIGVKLDAVEIKFKNK